MANVPVFSKQMLVEDVVNHNRNGDLRDSVFLRGNGDFFKSAGEKPIAAHLKSFGMEDQADKFELRYFNDYSVNNKVNKGYVLALKDPTADSANDLVDKYLKARKAYVDNRVNRSNEYRSSAIEEARTKNPNAFVGLPGKEFFSDPLTISKIGRNDLLKDKIESRPISNEIRSYDYTNDGTDSLIESQVALYEIYPKPDSNLSKEALITTIHSIYNTVEQNKEAQDEFDLTIQQQSFTHEDSLDGYTQNDIDFINRADESDLDIDIGQYTGMPFAQETGFNSKDYGEPVNGNSSEVPAQNPQDEKSKDKANPQFTQNPPKFKDPQLNNLIGDLVTKEEKQRDRSEPDDQKDLKGKKEKVANEPETARIAEMLAQVLAKIMEIILMVIKMILAMIMAAFRRQNVFNAANDVYQEYKNKPSSRGSPDDSENKKALEKSLDNSSVTNSIANGFAAGLNANNPNGNEGALQSVGNNSPPRASDLDRPFEPNAKTSLIQLPTERLDELKALNFDDEEIKALTSNIEVIKEHKVADGIADVPPEFGYSHEHGASLTVADTVKNTDGVEGTVLGGFEVDGAMHYAVASKDPSGNYEINSLPASDLTVIGYGNSELKDNPELISKLYEEQFKSVLADTPTAKDFKIPTPWSDTHFPWANKEKATITKLAEQGIPVVKGIKDIDLSNVRPFEDIKAEISEKHKDDLYLAAMHTNKTSSIREKVNAHPLYGELLNVNDKVSLNLPKSDRIAVGAVVGAYVNNDGDLKYQIKLQDGLITNVKANNLAVIEYDNGGLTKGEIKNYAGGMPNGAKLNTDEKINRGAIVYLSHENTDSYVNDVTVKHRSDVAKKYPNLVSGQQALDSNGNQQDVGRVISRVNENNKQEKFVTVGRFTKSIDGVERDVYMAMPAMTNPLTFNTARNKHFLKDEPQFFPVDDPKVKIEANGLTSAHLKEVVNKVSNFIHENIDKGRNDHIHKLAIMDHTTQDSLLDQIHRNREIEKQELNVKSALAFQTLYLAEPELSTELSSDITDVVDQTNQINDQFQNAIGIAEPLAFENQNSINPVIGATEYPKEIEKTGELFQGVDHSDLTLVRVQRGIDGIQVNGSNLILNHDMNNPDSVRNTMHFALNGHVNDHAYGSFNDANFALISNLKQTAQENEISGLSPSDTWFHAKDSKIVIPNATLIALENASIPSELESGNIKIVRFSEGDTPEQTLINRNEAISKELQSRNVPQFEVNMHNWAGHSFSSDDQLKLSTALGSTNSLPTNHSSSVDGELEQLFATKQSLKESFDNGEKQYLNINNGQWYALEDVIKSNEENIKELIKDLPESNAKEFFEQKLMEKSASTEANAPELDSTDFSGMNIPDNSNFIANEANDFQDQFIPTSLDALDFENNQNLNFNGPPLDSYKDDFNYAPNNAFNEDQFEHPINSTSFIQPDTVVEDSIATTVNEIENIQSNIPDIPVPDVPVPELPVSEPSVPELPVSEPSVSEPSVSEPPVLEQSNQHEGNEINFNALGYIEPTNPVHELPQSTSGYSELDSKLDNLRSMAINEPNDDPVVYVVNEVREELLGLQNSTLNAGKELFSHPNLKDEVNTLNQLSSTSDGSLIKFEDSSTQVTYPNVAQIKQLAVIGNIPEEARVAAEKLIEKMANDRELMPLVQNYIDQSQSLADYASTYTSEMSKFVSKTVEHEGFRSGYMGDEQKVVASTSIEQLSKEGSLLLDAIGNSQKNATYINASTKDMGSDVENLLAARTVSNTTNELKTTFVNELSTYKDLALNPSEKTQRKDFSNENTI